MKNRPLRYQAEKASLFDLALVVFSLIAALVVHKLLFRFFPEVFASFDMFWGNAWFYIPLCAIWGIVFNSSDLYDRLADPPARQILRVAKLSLVSFAAVFAFFYAMRVHNIPRTLVGLQCVAAWILVSLRAAWLEPRLLAAMPLHTVLAVGRNPAAGGLAGWLHHPDHAGRMQLVGCLCDGPEGAPRGTPRLGGTGDTAKALRENVVDTVLLFSDGLAQEEMNAVLEAAETQGADVWLRPVSFTDRVRYLPNLDEIGDWTLLVFSSPSGNALWEMAVKRMMDIVLSFLLLVLGSPLWLAIAVAVACSGKGPVVFRQRRCTLRGREFTMYKFRTMVADAEEKRGTLAAANESDGPVFKIRNDPRITRVGRFLRRYSLDEVPQLVNVLKGDMSLVGPRPPIPSEVAQYDDWQRRRLSMRTGCTCLWQVGGRNELDFDEWMRLDLRYIDHWSLALDLKILLGTVWAVLRGTGC
ncbi:MAG: sugar transferase [Kiritimatiellae bacterium]|nr:sugar transferase [Kiritimatiellia bacterium]